MKYVRAEIAGVMKIINVQMEHTHTHTLLYPWKVDHNVEQTHVDVTVGLRLAVAHDYVPFERITRVSARVGSEGREVQLH